MIDNIRSNWNLFRFIRLAIGMYILIDGIRTGMWMLIALGILFSIMPLLNIGCCATGNCAISPKEQDSSNADEVSYKEVKAK